MPAKASYAIIGAGIGGLALAGFLARNGVKVRVYEQAKEFQRIGAGIQMSPNAVRVLRALGLEPGLRKLAFYPPAWSHRVWDTGEHLADLTFGAEAEARYGAPYLLMHRGDLHAALFSAVPEELIAREKKLLGIDRNGAGVTLRFADGTSAAADAVIGADGVHSRVREILLGPEKPKFTGRVAHRTTFPAALMGDFAVDTCTKWWGPDRHIVIYPVRAAARGGLLRHQRAGPDVGRRILVVPRRDGGGAGGAWRASTRTCSACCGRARRCTSGRCSSAIRCPGGAKGRSPCWATPAIP